MSNTHAAAKQTFIGALLITQNTNFMDKPWVEVELDDVRGVSNPSSDPPNFLIVPRNSRFYIFPSSWSVDHRRKAENPEQYPALRVVDTPTQVYNYCTGGRRFLTIVLIKQLGKPIEDMGHLVWYTPKNKNKRQDAARHAAASVIQAHRKRQVAQRFYKEEQSLRPGGSGYLETKQRFERRQRK